MNKILILNTFGIGDVLFSTPLVRALKEKYADVSITYVCNRRAYGVLKNNPNISKIYIFEKDDYRDLWKTSKVRCLKEVYKLLSALRDERYDALIDMSLGYLFSMLLFFSARITRRIGFNYRDRGRFLTQKLDISGFSEKHVIEYYLELGRFLGIEGADREMDLAVAKDDAAWAEGFLAARGIGPSDTACAIIPGCGASWGKYANYRRWSPWKFAAVADHIRERHGHAIVVFGEEKEADICAKVASQMKSEAVQACGATTLGQLAALLDRCTLVVTNDGGPLHIAVALKKRTVAIFGPVDERIYGPYPPSDRYIVVKSSRQCRPCYKNFKHEECRDLDCLKYIEPASVMTAVDSLMERGV